MALQLGLLIAWTNAPATRASVPSAALSFLDSIAILALTSFGHSRSIRPISLLALYLLFSLLFNAAELRTLYLRQETSVICGLSTAVVGVKVVLLVLETRGKRQYLRSPYSNYSPEATSGVINRGVFWWLNPLIAKGFRKILSLEDLYSTDPELLSEPLLKRLQRSWNACKSALLYHGARRLTSPDRSTGQYALMKASISCFKWPLMSFFFPRLCLIGFNYAQPFLISRVVSYVGEPIDETSQNNGYGLIGATVLIYLGISVSRLLPLRTYWNVLFSACYYAIAC